MRNKNIKDVRKVKERKKQDLEIALLRGSVFFSGVRFAVIRARVQSGDDDRFWPVSGLSRRGKGRPACSNV